MDEKDELLAAIEKKRKENAIVTFFRDPLGVIRKKPIRIGYISGAIGAVLMLLIYFYDKSHADWTGIVAPYDAYILAGIAALVPPAYYMYKEDTRIKKADSEFPLLLRELAQAKRAGLTLVDSFRLISEGEYGILTESLRTTAYQLTWGVPFEEALRLFAERHPTKMIKRSIELIIEGYRVGGDVGSILKITADDVNEVRALEKKRATDMMPYIAICYITFGVFLLILMVLYNTFIPMMSEASEKIVGGDVGGAVMVKVDSEKMKMILFHCGMIQGFCSGFMAGKLGTGKVIAGLKHALLLALGAFALFAVLEFAPI
ncbi:MAG: type II secretion system F family protein [Methanophagales archaeon]|nr:type II secretion system F family protein [Methanophagales archaeon]